MFKGLKSLVSKAKNKVSSIFKRKKKGKTPKKYEIPTYPPEAYKKLDTRKNQIMNSLKESDDKARQFYINMLTSETRGISPDLIEEARELIYNATDDELDQLKDALGDNGDADWKDEYEAIKDIIDLEEDMVNDRIAKLEQIIQLLSKN